MTDDIHGENPPLGVWDAFEIEKRNAAYASLAESHVETLADLYRLIELLEEHPTAQAGALLESWRQRKTQPPTKNAG